MEIHHLRYVAKLAQRLHFSKAADELQITQPSLSQQIILIEKELGVKLFERKTRSVELTPAGEEFVAYSASLLKDWDRLLDAMHRHSSIKKGHLRLGTLVNMSLLNLNQHLQSFQSENPNILINIVEVVGSSEVLKLLESGSIDIGFAIPTSELQAPSEFISFPLIPGFVVAVLPLNHPLASRSSLRLHELSQENLIFPARIHSAHAHILNACRNEGFEPKIVGTNSQVRTGIDLAAKGFGICLLSSHFVYGADRSDVAIIPIEPIIPRDITMVYARKTADTFALNLFVTFFATAYGASTR